MNVKMPNPCALLLLIAPLMSFGNLAEAEPYVPEDEGEVVAELPATLMASGVNTERQLAPTLEGDIPGTLRQVSSWLALGKTTGDPRYYAYAERLLEPWWDEANPPPEIARQRAKVLRYLHQPKRAAKDFDTVLAHVPGDTEALLSIAIIYQDLGDYERAAAYCDRLLRFRSTYWQLCAADLGSVTGKAARSYELLKKMLHGGLDDDLKTWIYGLMADMDWRAGRLENAESNYKRALVPNPGDIAVNKRYLRFLLDTSRPRDVQERIESLAQGGSQDSYRLEQCMAAKLRADESYERCKKRLLGTYERLERRGDEPHYFDQGLFNLTITENSEKALVLARESWKKNKKPDDLYLLARAAAGAQDRTSLREAKDWLDETGLEDERVAKIVRARGVLP